MAAVEDEIRGVRVLGRAREAKILASKSPESPCSSQMAANRKGDLKLQTHLEIDAEGVPILVEK
jgi:hypothetical protein